ASWRAASPSSPPASLVASVRLVGVHLAPNLAAVLARARAASTSRLRGSAFVTRDPIRARAAAVTSSTAWSDPTSFALDRLAKPLSLRTNCSDAARISSSVAGGSKLKSVLMLLHMIPPADVPAYLYSVHDHFVTSMGDMQCTRPAGQPSP